MSGFHPSHNHVCVSLLCADWRVTVSTTPIGRKVTAKHERGNSFQQPPFPQPCLFGFAPPIYPREVYHRLVTASAAPLTRRVSHHRWLHSDHTAAKYSFDRSKIIVRSGRNEVLVLKSLFKRGQLLARLVLGVAA